MTYFLKQWIYRIWAPYWVYFTNEPSDRGHRSDFNQVFMILNHNSVDEWLWCLLN